MLDKDIITIVSEEIAYFLTMEKQAAIPGFGRFVSVAQSAKINEEDMLLYAPSTKINFEPNLEETNTNFTEYFAEYHTHATAMNDFVDTFISKIKTESSVLLPELGICILNKEGNVHFEGLDHSNSVSGFKINPIELKPVTKVETVAKPEVNNVPGAGATPSPEPIAVNSRSKLIRIGMVLSSLVLLIGFLSNYPWTEATAAEFQKVPTNYNVSPQEQEVIVASMDGSAPTSEISSERRGEIIERQRLMTEAIPEADPISQTASIVTNTFGSERNVNKQLELISDLGYQGSTEEKSNGLVSTLITVEYQSEEELDVLLDEIKKHFHRAKLKN